MCALRSASLPRKRQKVKKSRRLELKGRSSLNGVVWFVGWASQSVCEQHAFERRERWKGRIHLAMEALMNAVYGTPHWGSRLKLLSLCSKVERMQHKEKHNWRVCVCEGQHKNSVVTQNSHWKSAQESHAGTVLSISYEMLSCLCPLQWKPFKKRKLLIFDLLFSFESPIVKSVLFFRVYFLSFFFFQTDNHLLSFFLQVGWTLNYLSAFIWSACQCICK